MSLVSTFQNKGILVCFDFAYYFLENIQMILVRILELLPKLVDFILEDPHFIEFPWIWNLSALVLFSIIFILLIPLMEMVFYFKNYFWVLRIQIYFQLFLLIFRTTFSALDAVAGGTGTRIVDECLRTSGSTRLVIQQPS